MAITGADGHVGRALQRHLADLPNPIIPLARSDDWTVGLRGAEAVVQLAGTLQPKPPNSYQEANIGTVRRVLDAVDDIEVERIVFLSYIGADPESANEYLRSKGMAEELIRRKDIPHVILRSTFIYGNLDDFGPSFASYQIEAGGNVSVLGDGNQKVAPIHVDDLAAIVLAAALDPTTPTGTFEVSGPEVFKLDEFVQKINAGEVRVRHLPRWLARILARTLPQLTPALVDVLLADSVTATDPVETADTFGTNLHKFEATTKTKEEVNR